jgi:hypothetical protein
MDNLDVMGKVHDGSILIEASKGMQIKKNFKNGF